MFAFFDKEPQSRFESIVVYSNKLTAAVFVAQRPTKRRRASGLFTGKQGYKQGCETSSRLTP
jgi:hypothetical protein